MWWILACTSPDPVLLDRHGHTPDLSPALVSTPAAPPDVDEVPEAGDRWLPRLVLNEVMTSNLSTPGVVPGEFPDWIELYNDSDTEIDLAAVTFGPDGDLDWQGSGTLLPGELRVVDAEELGFNLSKDGEDLVLALHDEVVDRLSTGALAGDTSLARFPDGGEWAITTRPTPGWTNGSRPSDSEDPSDELFVTDHIHDVHLWLSDTAYATLLADSSAEVEASVSMRGAWFPAVTLRIKGQWGSARSFTQKCGLKVDLNAFEDHRIYGQETLTLNNMVQDPTYVSEHLAYEVFRGMGVPAPRTAWSRVTINGELFGLYQVIETIDDTFLDRWYEDNSGRMWEGQYGIDVDGSEIESLDYDEGPEEDDRSQLYAVSAILDGSATTEALAELETLVDMDEIIANMAVEAVTMHWDGYTTSNNYRLYADPTSGQLSILPWGTDQTFATRYYAAYGGYGRMFTWCLKNANCMGRYTTALVDAADLMDSLDLVTTMEDRLDLLHEDLVADPRVEFSLETHDAYVAAKKANIVDNPAVVRAAAAAH